MEMLTNIASSSSFPQLSANRWRYSGKEEQDAVTGLQHLDYGARHYDPFLGGWTTPDPMAEKYYGWSPYNFCAENPVNRVDLYGMDTWVVNKKGVVSYLGESKKSLLYYINEDQTLSNEFVSISNDLTLSLLENSINETKGKEIYATTSSSVDDIFKLFKFLADHTSSEWVIHKKGNRYVLGSLHDSESSGSSEDYGLSHPDVSIHSHPDVNPSIIDELESMLIQTRIMLRIV